MNGPRRLKYDDAFRRETGCDLGAEQRLVESADLSALRQAVIARAAVESGGAAVGSSWLLGGGGVALTAALALGLWSSSGPAPEPPAAVPEVAVISLEAPASSAADRLPAAEPVAGATPTAGDPLEPVPAAGRPGVRPQAPLASASAAPEAVAPAAASPAEVMSATDGVAAVVEAPDEPTSTVAARFGTLAHENATMDEALALLEAGRWLEASRGFQDYLNLYRHGTYTREASINILECHVQLGNHRSVEGLAALLAEAPELSERRPDLLRIRAEALAALGRCDEAIRVAEELPRKISRAVREGCEAPTP